MGDFVQHTEVKSAVRALANPIENIASFDALVQSVVSTNPFGCVSYISAGTTHAPVEKTKESYVVKIVYQDSDAKVIGSNSDKFNTVAGFNARCRSPACRHRACRGPRGNGSPGLRHRDVLGNHQVP